MDRENDENDKADPEDHRDGRLVHDAVPRHGAAVAKIGRKASGSRLERSRHMTRRAGGGVEGDQADGEH
jgi:hypothetical protein